MATLLANPIRGKVMLIKSPFLSKIIHFLLSLLSPDKTLFHSINNMCKTFLWNNKPPKFQKEKLKAENVGGGLKLYNHAKFNLALKLGWNQHPIQLRVFRIFQSAVLRFK